MLKHRHRLILASTSVLLLLGSATIGVAPDAALAQVATCALQTTVATPTVTTTSTAASAANLRLSPQQKQALCQAAENLERQNLGFSRDVSSALLPGTLGPVGPLAVTDIVAHSANPDSAARFDQTMAATTSGMAGSILLTSGLAGYLRALVDDSSESNFTEVVQPSPPPFVFPSAGADTNLPVAGTFRALLINESQAVGVAQTLLYSLRRARGAAAANNNLAQAQQLRAAALAAAQLATLLSREPLLRADVQGAMTTEGLPTIWGDPAVVASLQGAGQAMAQFAVSQGAPLPAPAPPLPATIAVSLPPPPPPPPPPPGAPAAPASTDGQ